MLSVGIPTKGDWNCLHWTYDLVIILKNARMNHPGAIVYKVEEFEVSDE